MCWSKLSSVKKEIEEGGGSRNGGGGGAMERHKHEKLVCSFQPLALWPPPPPLEHSFPGTRSYSSTPPARDYVSHTNFTYLGHINKSHANTGLLARDEKVAELPNLNTPDYSKDAATPRLPTLQRPAALAAAATDTDYSSDVLTLVPATLQQPPALPLSFCAVEQTTLSQQNLLVLPRCPPSA